MDNVKSIFASKKFWCALIACVAAVAGVFGLSDGSVEKITAVIGAFATLITYILVEGNIDAKKVVEGIVDIPDGYMLVHENGIYVPDGHVSVPNDAVYIPGEAVDELMIDIKEEPTAEAVEE